MEGEVATALLIQLFLNSFLSSQIPIFPHAWTARLTTLSKKTVHHNPPAFCKVCAQGPTNVVSCVMHTSCPRQEVRCEAEEEEEEREEDDLFGSQML